MPTKDEFSMTIYAVDDDELNLKLIKTILRQRGFTNLQLFFSGEELMEGIIEKVPDLILLDIMMPGMSGYDVLKAIKSDPKWKHIPIIMITAAPLENELEPLRLSFELGAMDYISKPFKHIELVMRVLSALRLEQQRQELENAIETINRLEKLLPICSYCKKVRSDNGYWQEVEVYITEHTDTMFSHSICPECYENHIKPQLEAMNTQEKEDKPKE